MQTSAFRDSLASHRRPVFLEQLSHYVSPDGPSGTVQGLATTVLDRPATRTVQTFPARRTGRAVSSRPAPSEAAPAPAPAVSESFPTQIDPTPGQSSPVGGDVFDGPSMPVLGRLPVVLRQAIDSAEPSHRVPPPLFPVLMLPPVAPADAAPTEHLRAESQPFDPPTAPLLPHTTPAAQVQSAASVPGPPTAAGPAELSHQALPALAPARVQRAGLGAPIRGTTFPGYPSDRSSPDPGSPLSGVPVQRRFLGPPPDHPLAPSNLVPAPPPVADQVDQPVSTAEAVQASPAPTADQAPTLGSTDFAPATSLAPSPPTHSSNPAPSPPGPTRSLLATPGSTSAASGVPTQPLLTTFQSPRASAPAQRSDGPGTIGIQRAGLGAPMRPSPHPPIPPTAADPQPVQRAGKTTDDPRVIDWPAREAPSHSPTLAATPSPPGVEPLSQAPMIGGAPALPDPPAGGPLG
ncbi:MAG: hypothetical protein M3N98_15940, partial [Actinomycetota bacterium]|nr:hypothetical protein [Actinomycetota bacterium]